MQKSVQDIFNNNVFSVPNYQRDYAWREKNFEDLWEDLLEAENVVNSDIYHFLGTIVVSKNENGAYDIIDGQQRSTTIFMLRYALNYKTSDPKWNLNNFLDSSKNYRLLVSDDNKEFFDLVLKQAETMKYNHLLKDMVKTQGHSNLLEVFNVILNKVSFLDENRATKLLDILNKMTMMWLEEKNHGRAIRMFQTINDRGVPLLILDKLKALLILYSNKYCDGALDDSINERFGEIFKIIVKIKNHKSVHCFGDVHFIKEIESRIFNYHCLSNEEIGHYRNGVDAHYVKLKEILKTKDKNQSFCEWIDEYSLDLRNFYQAFLDILEDTKKSENAFKTLCVLRINPYFYSTLTRLKINNLLDDDLYVLLAKAEVILYGLNNTNDAAVFGFSSHCKDKNELKDLVVKTCKDKIKRTGYGSVDKFINDIYEDAYGWGKYFHYLFLQKLQIDINSLWELVEEKTYALTIDHIVPQNSFENDSYKQYGFEDESDFENYINTFGNLIPLEHSLNSSNQDKSLEERQNNYKKSKLFYNVSFASSDEYLHFGKEIIIKNNKAFTQWAREFFADFL